MKDKEMNPISMAYENTSERAEGGNSTKGMSSAKHGMKKAERIAIGGSEGKKSMYGPDRGEGGNSDKGTSYEEKHGKGMSGKVTKMDVGGSRTAESGNCDESPQEMHRGLWKK